MWADIEIDLSFSIETPDNSMVRPNRVGNWYFHTVKIDMFCSWFPLVRSCCLKYFFKFASFGLQLGARLGRDASFPANAAGGKLASIRANCAPEQHQPTDVVVQ